MTTHYYTGSAIAVAKQLFVRPGSGSASQFDGRTISIGLGARLLEFTGFSPEDIVTEWNSSEDPVISQITASVETRDSIEGVLFVHQTTGEDFELTVLIDDEELIYVDEVQRLTFTNTPTGGTFTLTVMGEPTGAITYSATPATTAANILAALEALTSIQSGDVTITAVSATVFDISFANGQYQGVDVDAIETDPSSLAGGTATVVIATTQNGNAGTNEIQTIDFPNYGNVSVAQNEIQTLAVSGATGGTFDLTVPTYAPVTGIAYNANRRQIREALETVLGVGNVKVTGGPFPAAMTVEFIGELAGTDIGEMVGDGTNLTGSGAGTATLTSYDLTNVGGTNDSNGGTVGSYGWTGFYNGPSGSGTVSIWEALRNGFNHDAYTAYCYVGGVGSTGDSNFLKVSFTGEQIAAVVPSGSTIAGIEWIFDRTWTIGTGTATIADNLVKLFYDGAYDGDDQSDVTPWPVYPPITTQTYGGPADTWGVVGGIDRDTIATSGLGVGLSININSTNPSATMAYIYPFVLLKIYYTTGSGDPEVAIVTVQDGGTNSVPNIDGGTFALGVIPAGGNEVIVPSIPFDVTASELEALMNDVLGAGSVTCSDGPFPTDLITIEFSGGDYDKRTMDLMKGYLSLSGYFDGEVTSEVLRTAKQPSSTANTWDLTICPGYGTLAVDTSEGDYDETWNWFSFKITTADGLIYTSDKFRWPNPTAKKIEGVLNEMFGKQVCRVYQVSHTQKWAAVDIYGNSNAYMAWYNQDVFRIIFCNDYAEEDSITTIELEMAQFSGSDATPAKWMTLSDAQDPDDFQKESDRVYHSFVAADQDGQPLHLFSIERSSIESLNLSYRFKLIQQYAKDKILVASRSLTGDMAPDMKVRFHWKRSLESDYATGEVDSLTEQSGGTTLVSTDWLDWDAPSAVIQSALEDLWFGAGNVQVTGSLFNSWLEEEYVGSEEADDYSDLRVTLIGTLALLPLNELQYHLVMELQWPYTANSEVIDSDFAPPLAWRDTMTGPVPPLRSERQSLTPDVDYTGSLKIGYNGEYAEVELTSTAAEIEDLLNGLTALGEYNAGSPLPEKYRKAVTVYGSTLEDGIEIEFNGYGFQFQDVDPIALGPGPDDQSILEIIETQAGVAQQQEVQTITITGSPYSGTFKLNYDGNDTSALARTATAADVQTALRALAGLSPTNVTCTGGPLPATITCTFAQSLNNIAPLTFNTSTLKNAGITVSEETKGGTSGTLTVEEVVRGKGPSFYDCPDNWSNSVVPSSEDVIIIDDAKATIRFGIRQRALFVVQVLGASTRFLYRTRRKVFLDGQKVYVRAVNGGTLPTGLAAGYYYIRNSTAFATFQLSTTSNGSITQVTDSGDGDFQVEIREVDMTVYSRFTGSQIGLPNYRSSNVSEYLARYLEMGFAALTIGEDEGSGLNIGRFNTMDLAAAVTVKRTGSSSDPDVPAVLLLLDNISSTLDMEDGDVGIAVYADETSELDLIALHGGRLLISNTTVNGTLTADNAGADAIIRRSTVANQITVQ